MGNKRLQTKNIVLYSALVLSILAGVIFTQNCCNASEVEDSITEMVNINNSEMDQYIRQTRKRIKNNWYPPTASFENSAVLGLTINRKGELVDCKLLKASEDDGFNKSLTDAAKKTKYMPLPKDFIEDVVDLSLEFGMQKHSVQSK